MNTKINLLLIEDSPDDAELILDEIKGGGFDPVWTRICTAEELKEILPDREWDMVLCDYVLPGFSGLEAIKIIKRSNPLVPVILVSGHVGEDKAVEAMQSGASDYILKDNLIRLVPAIQREISEYKSRKIAFDRAQNLSRRLETIREDERKEIAKNLHDDLGQILTAIKMDLSWLEKRIIVSDPRLKDKMTSIKELVDHSIQTVQRLSSDLRPSILDDLGLLEAFKWQLGQFSERTGLSLKLDLPDNDPDLLPEQAVSVFRIVQEALTNIARHADATEVQVTIQKNREEFTILIKDNGKGISDEQINSPESLGIMSMKERVFHWNGRIVISGKKDKGTSIQIRFMLQNKR